MNAGFLIYLALGLAVFQFLMVLRNSRLYLPPPPVEGTAPPLSVLIPARNEEENLLGIYRSLEVQQGCDFEVLIFDDNSDDGTLETARALSTRDARVQVLSGSRLPAGWAGKQHACHVLAQAAAHDLLLFVDADVRFTDERALSRISSHLSRSEAAMLSAVPRQQTETWGERLIIPLIHLVLLGFLPFWEMRRNRLPALGAACGQLLGVKADLYHRVGGHGAVRHRLHDAPALAAHFREQGYLTDLFDATPLASCRMYHNAWDVFVGFAKNATEGMARPLLLPLWTFLLLGANLLPWLLELGYDSQLLTLGQGLNLLVYLMLSHLYRQDLLGALTRPLGVLLFVLIQWVALVGKWVGWKSTWKGRTYPRVHN